MKIEEMSDEELLKYYDEMSATAGGRGWSPEHKQAAREEILKRMSR